MKPRTYGILHNRRRSFIALIHSIFFAAIAFRSMIASSRTRPIWFDRSALFSTLAILAVYLIVSSILVQLVRLSVCVQEKLYFGFCATSASFGLLRTIFGDQMLPIGQYVRVLMLLFAVITGFLILRSHSTTNALSS
jgi:hypothetical protein